VSQYGNDPYKGPAPMVLGAMGEQPVCFYCNKPGHLKKDCFKLRNDLASRGGGRGNGRNGGGRNNSGRF
jgi:Zinc knuckle